MSFAFVCPHCGKGFIGPHAKRKYCSYSCSASARRGNRNGRFRGGLFQRKDDGRWMIVCRDDSMYLYARAVASAALGRELERGEIVHHVNGDPTDDRPENLEVITQSEHIKIHLPMMRVAAREARTRKARADVRRMEEAAA